MGTYQISTSLSTDSWMRWLGRPWNDLATTVFLRTFMDESIAPAGFKPFDSARPVIMNTTFYAEYDSFGTSLHPLIRLGADHMLVLGPGGNTSQRVSDHILNAQQAADFTLEKVFLGTPHWIDFDYEF